MRTSHSQNKFAHFLFAACLGMIFMLPAFAADGTHHLARKSGVAQGGDFRLDSVSGPVELKQFRGKVTVLYFGYTFCPDACPTTLYALGEAMKGLKPEEKAQIQPLFITLDPARDDVKRLEEYSQYFYPGMLGLRGTDAQLAAVARKYGVLYARQKVDSAADYVVDHSSLLYVIDINGKLVQGVPYGSSPNEIVAALRAALPHTHK